MVRQEFVEVDGNQMEMLVAEPEGVGPHPAVVIAMHLPAHMGLKEDAFTKIYESAMRRLDCSRSSLCFSSAPSS